MLLDKGDGGAGRQPLRGIAVVTPYENQLILMHEGASGGGKSEMTEHIHAWTMAGCCWGGMW